MVYRYYIGTKSMNHLTKQPDIGTEMFQLNITEFQLIRFQKIKFIEYDITEYS